MSLTNDLNAIKTVQDGVKNNKVTRFAYTQTAYDNNDVNGHDDYVATRDNNIPLSDLSVIEVNPTVVDKGFRARASALNRMFLNHLFGRISYNLNKVNDLFNDLLAKIVANLGVADGLATLDSTGRIPYSQLPEDAMEYQGDWNASTNTPALADGTGTKGDTYNVSVAGTQTFGGVSTHFAVGDRIIYNGSVWQKFASGDVQSVSEILPDPVTANVDLSQQADLTKIFNSSFLDKLLTVFSGAYWNKTTIDGNIYDYTEYDNKCYVITSTGLYSSTDRKSWTKLNSIDYNMGWILACPTAMVVACKSGNGYSIVRSTNGGISWSATSINDTALNWGTSTKITDLIYANGVYIIGTSNKGFAVSTDNGANWTITTTYGAFAERITYQNGKFFICVNTSRLISSPDGVNWTASTGIPMAGFCPVVYANGLYVVGIQGGSGYNNNPYWSTDGKAWTAGTGITDSQASNYGVVRIFHVNNMWFAVPYVSSSARPIIYWSTDGKAWTAGTGITNAKTGLSYNLVDMVYAEGVYVLTIGIAGTVSTCMFYSQDGKNWSAVSSTISGNRTPLALLYADNVFICLDRGSIFRSIDGVIWEVAGSVSYSGGVPVDTGRYYYKLLNFKNNLWFVSGMYALSGVAFIQQEG